MADARLEVTDALGRRIVPIAKSPFEIGRRETNDLRLAGSEVSRDHAEITIDSNRFTLHDRNSRYGTYVNGEQVTERVLAHGDKVRLGRTGGAEMVFLLADTQPPTDRATTTAIGDLRQIAALLEGLRALGSGRVLDDVLSLVLDSAIEVSGAERGFIMLALESVDLEFKMARGRGHITLSGGSFATSRKIPEEVFRTGEPRIVADLLDGDLANVHMGTVALGIRNVLCVPLRLVRYVDKAETRRRRAAHRRAVSRQQGEGVAVVGIDAGRARDAGHRGRGGDRERPALPRNDGKGADGAGDADRRGDPAGAAPQGGAGRQLLPRRGGVAAVPVDRRRLLRLHGNDATASLGFALGDVAGKGPPAALLSAMMQGIFAAQAATSDAPSKTITRVNLALYRRGIESRFVTLMYGVARAGRPADLLQRRPQSSARSSAPVGRPAARSGRTDRRPLRGRDLRGGDGRRWRRATG